MSIAKRVKIQTEESSKLEIWAKNFGIKSVKLYSYEGLIYFNADLAVKILNVDLNKFRDKASFPKEYVNIKNGLYVSKYGIIQLISMSKEAIAYILLDYVFDVVYKLEKNLSVSMEDVKSTRNALLDEIGKINIEENQEENKRVILEMESNIDNLHETIKDYKQMILKQSDKINELEQNLYYIENELNEYKNISRDLAIYCKLNPKGKKRINSKIDDSNLDLITESDEMDIENTLEILEKTKKKGKSKKTNDGKSKADEERSCRNAGDEDDYTKEYMEEAKKSAVKAIDKLNGLVTTVDDNGAKTISLKKQKYYILKSGISHRNMFKWKICDTLSVNYEELKKMTSLWKSRLIDAPDYILYQELNIYEGYYVILNFILEEIMPYCEESKICTLLNTIQEI